VILVNIPPLVLRHVPNVILEHTPRLEPPSAFHVLLVNMQQLEVMSATCVPQAPGLQLMQVLVKLVQLENTRILREVRIALTVRLVTFPNQQALPPVLLVLKALTRAVVLSVTTVWLVSTLQI
jgi:hypothetical protein